MSRSWLWPLVVLGGALLLSLPLWLPTFYIGLLIRIFFFSLVAMSLTFLAGHLGLISLAQATILSFSGYVVTIAIIKYGWDHLPAIGLALGSTLVLAAIFGALAIRTSGIYFLMITLALGQIVWGVAFQWHPMSGGFDGIPGLRAPTILGIDFSQTRNFYFPMLAGFALATAFLHRVINSPFGLAMRGIRESPSRMAALGYPVALIRYLAFLIAGGVAAIAGIYFAYYTGVMSPTALDLFRNVWVLVMAILGGIGSLVGAVLGTVIVLLMDVVVSQWTPRYMSVIGLVFVLTILFAPDGITGRIAALVRRAARRPGNGAKALEKGT